MITFLGTLDPSTTDFPLYSFQVPAGFPFPAADHLGKRISLDELLDLRAPLIYLVRVEVDSMIGAGIYPVDLVLFDRSISPEPGHILIAAVNCEPLCKRFAREGSQVVLRSENPRYPSRYLLECEKLEIRGVVTYTVRRGTMRLASVSADPSWGMRRELMIQSYTTQVGELWTVYCK
ncbi:peptidase S24 [Pseudomonas putida]|nr:S24 family peptidase [Pseudomonas putida]MBF8660680.1 peptidase S24 [Pseudomonas putida]